MKKGNDTRRHVSRDGEVEKHLNQFHRIFRPIEKRKEGDIDKDK